MEEKKTKFVVESPVRRDGTREGEVVSFEAVIRSETGESMFAPETFLTPENIDRFVPGTGAGLVDAYKAYRLARSIMVRPLHTLPSPI